MVDYLVLNSTKISFYVQVKRTGQGKTQDAASSRQKQDDASSNGYLDTNAADDASPRRSRAEMEDEEERDEFSQSLSESRTSGSLSLSSSRDASHYQRGRAFSSSSFCLLLLVLNLSHLLHLLSCHYYLFFCLSSILLSSTFS